jgi:hypothetical protein
MTDLFSLTQALPRRPGCTIKLGIAKGALHEGARLREFYLV